MKSTVSILAFCVMFVTSCKESSQAKHNTTQHEKKQNTFALKDTLINLSISFDTGFVLRQTMNFSWDINTYSSGSVSKNIMVVGSDTNIVIYPVFPGKGHLYLFDKQGDTLVTLRVNITAPIGWEDSILLSKSIIDNCNEESKCENSSPKFSDASDWLRRGDYLLNKQVPYFSITSIQRTKLDSKNILGKATVLVIYEYGCAACSELLSELQSSNLKGQDNSIINFCANECLLKNDSIFYVGDQSKGKLYYWKVNPIGEVCSRSGNIISKFYTHGYPKVFITDRNGFIRIVFNGYYDGIAKDIEAMVALLNKIDITLEP